MRGTIQFYIPRVAANALPIETMALKARASNLPGLETARLEYSDISVPRPGLMRITCSMTVAQFLANELELLAGDEREKRKTEIETTATLGATAAR